MFAVFITFVTVAITSLHHFVAISCCVYDHMLCFCCVHFGGWLLTLSGCCDFQARLHAEQLRHSEPGTSDHGRQDPHLSAIIHLKLHLPTGNSGLRCTGRNSHRLNHSTQNHYSLLYRYDIFNALLFLFHRALNTTVCRTIFVSCAFFNQSLSIRISS